MRYTNLLTALGTRSGTQLRYVAPGDGTVETRTTRQTSELVKILFFVLNCISVFLNVEQTLHRFRNGNIVLEH